MSAIMFAGGPTTVDHSQPEDLVVFEAFMRRHYEASFRLAVTMLGTRAEAEDAVQDAALRAWQAWKRLRDVDAERPWFLAIVANVCRSARRRRHRWELPLAPSSAAVSFSAGSDRSLDMRRALSRLTYEQRLIVVLRFYVDLPHVEIAAITGLNEPAVRARLSRTSTPRQSDGNQRAGQRRGDAVSNADLTPLRDRLHQAFDSEQPRPEAVDEIIDAVRSLPHRRIFFLRRPTRSTRAVSLAVAVAVPSAMLTAAVIAGVALHGRGGPHVSGTPQGGAAQASPLPVPAHYIPWRPIPAQSALPAGPAAVPAGTPACRAADLEGAQVGGGTAAGNENMPVVLRDRGATACAVQGFADVQVLDSGGHVLAGAIGTQGRGTAFGDASVLPVLVQPGTPPLESLPSDRSGSPGQAFMNLEWTDCRGVRAQTLAIELPGSAGRLVIPFVRQGFVSPACGSQGAAPSRLTRGPLTAVPSATQPDTLLAQIAAPARVRAGSTLVYYVTLSNSGQAEYAPIPCPSYRQTLDKGAETSSFQLDCSAAGALLPGAAVTYEMRFALPAELALRQYELSWGLSDGRPNAPSTNTRIEVIAG